MERQPKKERRKTLCRAGREAGKEPEGGAERQPKREQGKTLCRAERDEGGTEKDGEERGKISNL
jgi:hypothetical protein